MNQGITKANGLPLLTYDRKDALEFLYFSVTINGNSCKTAREALRPKKISGQI